MVVAVLVVGGFSVASQASAQQPVVSASDIQYAATVKVGSSGQASLIWQKFFNGYSSANLVADGAFGPLTSAAAKIWQASRGLVADGVMGPMSRAAAIAQIGGGMPVASGCQAGWLFNPATGASCSVTQLPAGCQAGWLFNPTTGTSCTVTPAPVSSTGEGSVAVTYAPVPADGTSVNRGEFKNVMALEVKATGSDMQVNRVWLDIGTRIWLSASEVALMDGSTVVATLPLSASTVEEITAGSSYRLQFNGLNITVPVNTTKTLTFKLTRPQLTNSNENVVVANTSSIRTTDGAGYSETTTFAGRTWVMANAVAATGTLTSTLNVSSISSAQSVSGLSTTASQLTAVKLMDFNLKAEDGAVNITSIVGGLGITAGTLTDMVASVELRDGSTVLSSKAGAASVTFNALNIDVAEDATKTLSVWAQMNPIGSGAGYTTKGVGINGTIGAVTATSGATFATASTTNTVTGYAQHMFAYAPTLTLGATSAISSEGSAVGKKQGDYSIAFTVTAPSNRDIYIDTPTTLAAVAKTAASYGGTLVTSSTVSGVTSKGATFTTADKVTAGTSRTFTFTGTVPTGGATGYTGMKLVNVTWTDTDDGSNPALITQTWGLADFKTAEVYVTAS